MINREASYQLVTSLQQLLKHGLARCPDRISLEDAYSSTSRNIVTAEIFRPHPQNGANTLFEFQYISSGAWGVNGVRRTTGSRTAISALKSRNQRIVR
jgi:hypothetical protein